MIYRFQVEIRLVGRSISVIKRGGVNAAKLMTLDGVGFYLTEPTLTPGEIRGYGPFTIHGFVVLDAANPYEALAKFFKHPGVIEGEKRKAIVLLEDRPIEEMPDCYNGCFRVNEKGWAMCDLEEVNHYRMYHQKVGYCALLQMQECIIGCPHAQYDDYRDVSIAQTMSLPAITFVRHNIPED